LATSAGLSEFGQMAGTWNDFRFGSSRRCRRQTSLRKRGDDLSFSPTTAYRSLDQTQAVSRSACCQAARRYGAAASAASGLPIGHSIDGTSGVAFIAFRSRDRRHIKSGSLELLSSLRPGSGGGLAVSSERGEGGGWPAMRGGRRAGQSARPPTASGSAELPAKIRRPQPGFLHGTFPGFEASRSRCESHEHPLWPAIAAGETGQRLHD